MPDLFISYAREDTEFVRRVYDDLVQNNREAWVDWEDIPLTADWLQEAYSGIEGADAFVFVISPASVRSGPCVLELEHALQNNKRLIPLLRREILDPEEQKLMHPSLSAHNWVKFRDVDDYERAFQSVLSAIDTDLSFVRAHTRYVVRTAEWDDKGRDPSLLLRGNELREAEAWLVESQTKQPHATDQQREYILASRAEATRRFRLFVLGVSIVLIMASLAIFALVQRESAVQNEAAALAAKTTAVYNEQQAQSFALAANAQQLLYRDNNTDLAIALALESNQLDLAPPLARSILAQAAYAAGTRQRFDGYALYADADLAVSPDATLVLSPQLDDSLALWNLETQEVVYTWDFGDTIDDRVWTANFSPDGKLAVVTLAGDGPMILLDVTTGEEVYRWTGDYVINALFTADNQHLVAGYTDGKIILWNIETRAEVRRFAGVPDTNIFGLALNPGETLLAAGFEDGSILLWDFATTQQLRAFVGHSRRVRSLVFSPDGTQLLSGSSDFSVRLWNVETAEPIFQMLGHKDRVRRVMFSPDGQTAFSAASDSRVIEWDIASGQSIHTYVGHLATVYAVISLPDNRILTGSSDGTIRVWDTINGAQIQRLDGHLNIVYTVAMSPDGRQALSGGQDRQVILWDLETGQPIYILNGHADGIRGVVFSPDGKTAISTSRDTTLILWDLETGQAIRTFNGHDDVVWGVDFSPDGKTAISGSWDGTLILWDVETGRPIRRFIGHESRVYNVSISPDGKQALSGSSDKDVILWDVETGAIIHRLEGHDGAVYDAIFSPDGKWGLSSSQDLRIILWNLQTGEKIREFTGHTLDITSVGFTPDGHRALSASQDGTIRLWNVDSGAEILLYNGHAAGVWDVEASLDSSVFISGSVDTTVRRWRIQTPDELTLWTYANRYIASLTCEQRELYLLSVRCNTQGIYPTITPYKTAQPLVVASPTPGSEQTPDISATPSASITPSLTPLPSLTLGTAVQGNLAPNTRDWYTFNGTVGQIVVINLMADNPANAENDAQRQEELGLLDAYLTLYAPNGALLAYNDDILSGQTDSRIEPFVLPLDGVYTVQVNNGANPDVGGGYTLLIQEAVLPTPTPLPSATPPPSNTPLPSATPSPSITVTPG
ncbi:MAG: TIR domain-containing protein [Anaerolineae bacterium]|nr:TIR domain-containing protein [Anaerolineae bacterium]